MLLVSYNVRPSAAGILGLVGGQFSPSLGLSRPQSENRDRSGET